MNEKKKIGIKVHSENQEDYVKEMADSVDFIEFYANVKENFCFLYKYKNEKPIVIHCEHSGDAINLSDKSIIKKNTKAMKWAIHLADKFNSKKIIIHPGYRNNRYCSFENLIKIIKANYDKRFLIESMPYIKNSKKEFFCYEQNEIKILMKKCKIGFCLDFNHSTGSAFHRNKSLTAFLKKLLLLKPKHFHISDVNLEKGNEVHMNFFDGTANLKLIKKLIPKNAWVTLEVPHNIEKNKQEIKFLRD